MNSTGAFEEQDYDSYAEEGADWRGLKSVLGRCIIEGEPAPSTRD